MPEADKEYEEGDMEIVTQSLPSRWTVVVGIAEWR